MKRLEVFLLPLDGMLVLYRLKDSSGEGVGGGGWEMEKKGGGISFFQFL